MPTIEKPATRKSKSSEVVSFRLKNEEIDQLKKDLSGIVPGDSRHHLARKVLRDFIDGRVVYLSRQHRVNSRVSS